MDSPAPRPNFTKEQAEEAVALADFAVVREAMGRTNPHDLNNIRNQIHIATRLEKKGEPGFHQFLDVAMKGNTDPLVLKGLGVIANKLNITLTDEEKRHVDSASAQLSFLKLTARQQPEDMRVDMRALKRKITPASIYDYEFNYPTAHNPDHYYETMLEKGVPENQAADEAALLQLTLYRIGLTLKRFNPNFNNPVEFVDIAVDRVINHNHHKMRSSMPSHMRDYLKDWAQEVKTDYIGAKNPEQVRKVISDVTFDLLLPGRSRRRPESHATAVRRASRGEEALQFSSQTQILRNFRDRGEENELPRKIPDGMIADVGAAMTMLGNAFCERHDVTNFFESYLNGATYETMPTEKRRIIKGVIEEVCDRLGVPVPGRPMPEDAPAPGGWQSRVEEQARQMRGPRVPD